MAHNLFGNAENNDVAFIENTHNGRQLAWHQLGRRLPETFGAVDGVNLTEMDYKIGKFPLLVKLPNPANPAQFFTAPVEDQFALMRQPTRRDPQMRYLGSVGKDYTVVQNTELAGYIDAMVETAKGSKWAVETIGALGMGDKVFFTLQTGEFQIKGDTSPIKKYFFVYNYHNGTGALTFGFTGVRIVCQNTLNMALGDSSLKISLRHGQLIKQEAKQLMDLYAQLQQKEKKAEDILNKLASHKLDLDTAKDMVSSIYKMPAKPQKVALGEFFTDGSLVNADMLDITNTMNKAKEEWEKQCETQHINRFGVMALLSDYNDALPDLEMTGYNLYQSVAEWEDWGKKGKDKQTTAEAVMFGDRAKFKAKALEVISR